jgi:hypothetical protein
MVSFSRFLKSSSDGDSASVVGLTWWARIAVSLGLLGAVAVAGAWKGWPVGEGVGFEIVFSVGMLGVNAAWLLGAGVILRVLLRAEIRRKSREALSWGFLAVLLAEGVFW